MARGRSCRTRNEQYGRWSKKGSRNCRKLLMTRGFSKLVASMIKMKKASKEPVVLKLKKPAVDVLTEERDRMPQRSSRTNLKGKKYESSLKGFNYKEEAHEACRYLFGITKKQTSIRA